MSGQQTTGIPGFHAVPVADSSPRGARVKFREEDEFHQCWYPVALSSEVGENAVIGAPFLDGRVVVYRTSDGMAHVKSAYCRHLGADLSIGRLVGDQLQCPFHFWRYGTNGACTEVPSGDRPPPRAKLFNYPTAESLGIIWVFNGETALYSPPSFECSGQDLIVDAFRNPRPMRVDSSIVFLNSFDLQHFRVVHDMPMEVDQNHICNDGHTLTYQARVNVPEFGEVVQYRKLWGVNTVTVSSETNGRRQYLLHSLCPVSAATTEGFLVAATPVGSTTEDVDLAKALVARLREYSLRLINEDAPIFETVSFRRDNLTASDRFLAFGIRYICNYPRAHPGREMIR
ncbi:Rieske 2Fe-2S domain-containing protein [Paraburkholderia sp.]|uniref:Rieske 2Fe-2S domain-containing protein n=1 Tax=Paraburkholderia sp. TaxID=1926495 RepID=UPI0039E5A3A5